jgi:hypothetical protein
MVFGSKKVVMDMASIINEHEEIFVWITRIMTKIEKTTYADKLIIRDSKSACGSLQAMKQKSQTCIISSNHRTKDKNI